MSRYLQKIVRQAGLKFPPLAKLYSHRNHLLTIVSELEREKNQLIDENNKLNAVLGGSTPKPKDPTSILSDPYIDWIKVGVVGWCPDSNIEIIDECMKQLPKGAVIEIGSFCGLSASIIAHSLRRHKRDNALFTVDNWFYEGYVPGASISDAFSSDDWRQHTENVFELSLKLSAKKIKHAHIKLNSNDFFEQWKNNQLVVALNGQSEQLGGDIAFAYIDGDHSYTQSKQDFMHVDQFLVPGGFVFLDDTGAQSGFGCKDVAKEIQLSSKYQQVFQDPEGKANKCFQKKY